MDVETRLGVPQGTIAQFERMGLHRIPCKFLYQLSKIYGIDEDEFSTAVFACQLGVVKAAKSRCSY